MKKLGQKGDNMKRQENSIRRGNEDWRQRR